MMDDIYSVPEHCVRQFKDRCKPRATEEEIRNAIRAAMHHEVSNPRNDVVDLGRGAYTYLVKVGDRDLPGMVSEAYIPVVPDEKFGGDWAALTTLSKTQFDKRRNGIATDRRKSTASLAMQEEAFVLAYDTDRGAGLEVISNRFLLGERIEELNAKGFKWNLFEPVPKTRDEYFPGVGTLG